MKKIFLLLFLFAFIISCNNGHKKIKETVFVSILPQKYFVQRIIGTDFTVNVMVKPGENPAMYEPTIEQLSNLKNTLVYFSIGVPFEKVWIPKIKKMFPDLKIVDTSQNIKKRFMDTFDRKKNNSQNPDPHIWLSPNLVKIQAKTIYQTLSELFPEKKDIMEINYQKFVTQLDSLHNVISDNLKNLKNRKFAVFHPSWGYFADEFNLKQIPIEIEGKEPTAIQLEKIISILKKQNIKIIFVQQQFSTKLAEAVARQINGKVVRIDPLSEDYINNLIEISQKMKSVL
jgi:zinc transport system substrate-binding protein